MKTTLLITMFLLLLAIPAAPQAPDDKLIVAGERIGRWTLGVSNIEIENAVRPPGTPPNVGSGIVDVRPGDDFRVSIMAIMWPQLSFGIGINDLRSGKAIYLFTFSNEFKTAKELGPGSNLDVVDSAYGRPTGTTAYRGLLRTIYDELGLAFVARGNTIIQVFVFRPGTGKMIWRF